MNPIKANCTRPQKVKGVFWCGHIPTQMHLWNVQYTANGLFCDLEAPLCEF